MSELIYEYYKKLLKVKTNDENAVVSRYLRGEKYEKSEIKLLIIGRALNGWPADFVTRDIDRFRELWEKQEKDGSKCLTHRSLDKGKTPLKCEQVKGIEWVETSIKKNNRWYSTVRKSKFWAVAKEIAISLLNLENGGDWTKYVAWTNLAKLAPKEKGNPKGNMWDDQKEIAPEILKEELYILAPTHVLVIANKENDPENDEWTKPFYSVLENYKNSRKDIDVKIAYMLRPEFKKREESKKHLNKAKQDLGVKND